MKEAISAAENKKFSEFSKKVKTSLEDKLRNNPTIVAKGNELKSHQNNNAAFLKISSTKKQEPQEPQEVSPQEPQIKTED